MLRSKANMFCYVTVCLGSHIKYDCVQTEADYILLRQNVGNTDSLALVFLRLFYRGNYSVEKSCRLGAR